jgi:hypothetical protein
MLNHDVIYYYTHGLTRLLKTIGYTFRFDFDMFSLNHGFIDYIDNIVDEISTNARHYGTSSKTNNKKIRLGRLLITDWYLHVNQRLLLEYYFKNHIYYHANIF